MTSGFQCRGKKSSMHCYRSGSLCGYTDQDFGEKMAMKLYSWVSKRKKEKHTTQPEMGPLQESRCSTLKDTWPSSRISKLSTSWVT